MTTPTAKNDEYRIRHLLTGCCSHIVDIGANIGLFSLFARQICPNVKIISIEPHPEAYNRLCRNISNMNNIKTYNMALGDGSLLYLHNAHSRHWNESIFMKNYVSNCSVASYRLSDIFAMCLVPFDSKYFLKIDTEGGERYLIDHENSETIISSSVQTSMELHFPCRKRPQFSKFPSLETYKTWLTKFDNTHDVKYYNISLRGGVAICIMRNRLYPI